MFEGLLLKGFYYNFVEYWKGLYDNFVVLVLLLLKVLNENLFLKRKKKYI